MPERSTKADHKPVRTCVVCKGRFEQNSLLSFYLMGSEIVFDIKRAVANRKSYVCNQEECLIRLSKWLNTQRRKSVRRQEKA